MNVSGVNLLPPLFERVARRYNSFPPRPHVRERLVSALGKIIIRAAAAKLRDEMLKPQRSTSDEVFLDTSDRFSGR